MKISFSRAGFLLCCFLLPGLIGTFATFSIPVQLVDEQHQQAALNAVLAAPDAAAQNAAIASLPNDVDTDTAAMVMRGNGDVATRVAAAEQNMRGEVLRRARDEAYRIRLMVITFTVLCAAFGVALLGPGRE